VIAAITRWLKARRRGSDLDPILEVRVDSLRFVSEQDGAPERDLKARWLPILAAHPEVKRAYLAVAEYEAQPGSNVVLCIRSDDPPTVHFIEELRAPFAAVFNRDAHLDVAFVSDAKENEITRVCRPFWPAT
jgi:hypothetical protein